MKDVRGKSLVCTYSVRTNLSPLTSYNGGTFGDGDDRKYKGTSQLKSLVFVSCLRHRESGSKFAGCIIVEQQKYGARYKV